VSDSGIRHNTGELLAKELTGIPKRARDLNDLLERLVAADDPATAQQVVDNVSREAEQRARDGLFVDLAEVMWRLHERQEALHDGDLQRAFRQGVRRLEKPALMHGLAGLLPHRREMREKVTMILARSNEVGAEALIDCLVNSDSTAERKAYRVALSQCPAAVPALLHLLGDERWYVVRNAVELLGDLRAEGVESRLAATLNHHEPRVRRAAAIALAKSGTSAAVLVLLQHASDPSPDVRLQVALGLGEVRNPRAVPWLIEAFEKEEDPEVQGAILGALGRMPTDDAIERLARAAQPGGLLMRKPAGQRITAVEALGAAGTPNALAVLRGLQKDRDRTVRAAVERALNARREL
jgi:HEAT repeat protein